jgi:hypothetical protein
MTGAFYRDHILEPVVKPWIKHDPSFVLEEDRDSGHGIGGKDRGATKLVNAWKRENNLKCYFNCTGSPDLAPIENAWQPVKQHIRKAPHFTKGETIKLALEGWEGITQDWINARIETIPKRLQDVVDAGGLMTGW